MLKIAVVSLWTSEIQGWCEHFADNKAKYCSAWNLDFFGYDHRIDESREPTWSKIAALGAHLPDYDWLFWIDADAIITNLYLDIRDLCDINFDLIVTHDHNGLNAGVFLIQNTMLSSRFLDMVWKREIKTFHFEQTAMEQIIAEMPELKVKILHKRTMNSYWFDHRPGDFVIHAAGENNDVKWKLLTVFSNASQNSPACRPTEWVDKIAIN